MTPLEQDAADYELWLRVHNYATTTIACRHRYLNYFFGFAAARDVECRERLTLELLVAYQHDLYLRRKRNGMPLSVGTQAQRLLPWFSSARGCAESTASRPTRRRTC